MRISRFRAFMGPPRKPSNSSSETAAEADTIDPQQILTWAKRRYPELAQDLERLWRVTTPTKPYRATTDVAKPAATTRTDPDRPSDTDPTRS